MPFGSEFSPGSRDGATGFFFFKWSYIYNIYEKYLNIAILFRSSPRFRNDIENSIQPFSIGLRDFFQEGFCGFLKKVSPDF